MNSTVHSPAVVSGRALSPLQIALFMVVALLAVAVEVLILRAYFNNVATSAFFERTSYVTTDLANIQREALLLQLEVDRYLQGRSREMEPLELRRSLLANQLRVQATQSFGNLRVSVALRGIQSTLYEYDNLIYRFQRSPEPERGEIAAEVRETLAMMERQVKVIYDQEEISFFEATSIALRGQRSSQVLLLALGGLVLALGVVLALSLRRTLVALRREMVQRARAEAENRQLAESLEGRVTERTAELTSALGKLEEASRHKSEFLANMSHELRTPLNAIIGYSEMLQEQAEDRREEEFIPDLQRVQAAGHHLLALINCVLDLSKIEAGKMELYLETFSVSEMVQGVVTVIEPLVEKNANRLEVSCNGDLGSMVADMTKARQTLINLLSNACKFTDHGVISLDVARQHSYGTDWISFSVADTGIGISPEQVDRLFQPFSQADASTTRRYGGTGLGLILSRNFCRMMGGDVSVDSQRGRGSTFRFILPAEVARPRVESEDLLAWPAPGKYVR